MQYLYNGIRNKKHDGFGKRRKIEAREKKKEKPCPTEKLTSFQKNHERMINQEQSKGCVNTIVDAHTYS